MAVTVQPITNTPVTTASSGDNNVIAGVSGQKVYLYEAFLVAAGAVTLTIKDGTTALTGAMTMATGVPFVLPVNPDGSPHLVTSAGNALNFNLGTGVQLSGWIRAAQVGVSG